MRVTSLDENISAAAAAAQTAVQPATTPVIPGRTVVCCVNVSGLTGTPTIKVQGSNDGTNYVDLVTVTAIAAPNKMANVLVYPFMRLNVTVAGSAGTVSAYLMDGA